MSKTATFFTHKSIEGPARFISVLTALGFELTHIYTPEYDLKEFDALKPDLLIVMGGPMGTYEAAEYPYLSDEIEILKKRIAADVRADQLDTWCEELIDCQDLEADIKTPIDELMPDLAKQCRKFMHEWLNDVGLIS